MLPGRSFFARRLPTTAAAFSLCAFLLDHLGPEPLLLEHLLRSTQLAERAAPFGLPDGLRVGGPLTPFALIGGRAGH